MARVSFAIQKIIPPGANDPRLDVVDGAVLHVAVSAQKSLFSFFRWRSGGIESHFYIRKDGTIEQYRDTDYEADAQAAGNSWFQHGRRHGYISIETEGFGPGTWTPAQIASIQKLLTELRALHGFPMRKAPGPFSPGVGYHRLYGQWNPSAHSCPGNDRVKQFDTVLMPWFCDAPATVHLDGPNLRLPRFNPRNYYIGARGQWVEWLGKRLVAHGFAKHGDKNGYQPGKVFTKYDRANVRDFQLAQGWTGSDADGFPGMETLLRLNARVPMPKHKADVTPTPKPAPKPHVPTRIERARDHFNAGIKLLRDAQHKQGRTGWVKIAADAIQRVLDHTLPKK